MWVRVWKNWYNYFRKQFGKTILQKVKAVLPLSKTVLTPEQAILLRYMPTKKHVKNVYRRTIYIGQNWTAPNCPSIIDWIVVH